MSKHKNVNLNYYIHHTEYILAKYQFVLSHFPDCTLSRTIDGFITEKPIFMSKLVNQNYTHLDFDKDSWRINVIPTCQLDFEFQGKKEKIIIHSSPKYTRLARVGHKRLKLEKEVNGQQKRYFQYEKDANGRYIRYIIFSRLAFNLKNNNFNDKMLNDCQTNMVKFIQEHPDCKIDDKHLDSRLKKLLSFL